MKIMDSIKEYAGRYTLECFNKYTIPFWLSIFIPNAHLTPIAGLVSEEVEFPSITSTYVWRLIKSVLPIQEKQDVPSLGEVNDLDVV